jgi:hypothetical protein
MSDSPTKQNLDSLLEQYPAGDEHTAPARAMLVQASIACNGAPDKIQALSDALGGIALFLAMVHRGEPKRIAAAVTAGLRDHIDECPALLAARANPAPSAPESPQNVKTMLATALANNLKAAILAAALSLTAMVISLGAMIVYTRQIPEAAQAAQTLKHE